jgi:hypothetical protein
MDELVAPPDDVADAAFVGLMLSERARSAALRHRCDEAVATTEHRLDHGLLLPVVAHRPPGVLDLGRQRRLADEAIAPHVVEQLLLRDDAITMYDEIGQHIDDERLELDDLAVAGQLVAFWIQLEPGPGVPHGPAELAGVSSIHMSGLAKRRNPHCSYRT